MSGSTNGDGKDSVPKPCVCNICQQPFASKSKLFKHLESHGYEGPNTKPEKVVILVGWLAEYAPDEDEWFGDYTAVNTSSAVAASSAIIASGLDTKTSADLIQEESRQKGSGSGTVNVRDIAPDRVEDALYKALYAIENGYTSVTQIPPGVIITRPRGLSRGSSCLQRSSFLLGQYL